MIESRAAISKHRHLSFLQTWEAPRILRHKSAHPLQDGSWDDNTNPQLVGSPKNHSSRLPQHHTSSCGCHATGQRTPLLSRLTGKGGFRHHTRKDAVLTLLCKEGQNLVRPFPVCKGKHERGGEDQQLHCTGGGTEHRSAQAGGVLPPCPFHPHHTAGLRVSQAYPDPPASSKDPAQEEERHALSTTPQ